MSPDDYRRRSAERRNGPVSLENPSFSLASNSEELLALFGVIAGQAEMPHVTTESAMKVPAVFCAVGFLSRCLASLPLHAYRKTSEGDAARIDNDLQMLLNEAANDEWTSFDWREYSWQQVFTGGRGVSWIERAGVKPVAIWPMDPDKTIVIMRGGRRFYRFEGQDEYPAADVIDVPFMLKRDQLSVRSPIREGRDAIGLALAMNSFAGGFFGSGGTPPLSLEGPLPQGPDAYRRAQADIKRAIDMARKTGLPFFGMPPGHSLKPVGIDPAKGQMTEARLFQVQEIARIWGLPPSFLQDLSKGTFSNVEQDDLRLIKHTIGQWAGKFEQQLNLKLFGRTRRARYVEHSLDGLARGAFKDRIEAIARGIQTAQITPNEARGLENRAPLPEGDKLYIQGATVPLGTQPLKPSNGDPVDGNAGDPKDA